MSLPDLAADLPPPRDDEPASLRRDIVDELADHLDCALRRELLKQPGPVAAAEARVVEKFGDPRSVARKLWFDALREQIMSQRLILAGSLTMAVVCVVITGVMYRSLERMRISAAESQSQLAAVLGRMEESQARLLTDLDERAAAPAVWNPVEIKLVSGAEEGPPAVGFEVRLTDVSRDRNHVPAMTETTGEDGIARFPHVHDGRYELLVSAPWQEYHLSEISLHPGEQLERTIVCPAEEPKSSLVTVEVDWPEDLQERPIYICFFPYTFNRAFGKSWDGWSTWDRYRYFPGDAKRRGGPANTEVERGLFVGPDGRFYTYGSSLLRYNAKNIPEIPENRPHAHLIRWQDGTLIEEKSVVYLVPSNTAEFRDGESPEDTRERLDVVTASYVTYTPMEWTPGEPGRVVITPPKEAIETLRKHFAGETDPVGLDQLLTLGGTTTGPRKRVLMPGEYQFR